MCVCACVCTCVCMHACMHMHVCMCVDERICMYIINCMQVCHPVWGKLLIIGTAFISNLIHRICQITVKFYKIFCKRYFSKCK